MPLEPQTRKAPEALRARRLVLILMIHLAAAVARAEDRIPRYEEPLPVPKWLEERGRFLFSSERRIGIISLEDAGRCGVNIYCGGTNAGYLGFAGGPYNWDGKNHFSATTMA